MSQKRISINIGDRAYSVPVMNLGQLEEFLDLDQQLGEEESLRAQLPVLRAQVLVALSRENPEVTDGELRRDLTLEDLFELKAKLCEAAGLVKRQEGEKPADPSTGRDSTPTSPPLESTPDESAP